MGNRNARLRGALGAAWLLVLGACASPGRASEPTAVEGPLGLRVERLPDSPRGVFPFWTSGSEHDKWLGRSRPAERDGVSRIEIAPVRGGVLDETRGFASGTEIFVNWADVPALAVLGNGVLLASWLERAPHAGGGYGANLARTRDRGASWGPPRDLASDTSGPEYGFVSLVPYGTGECLAVWLDGRGACAHGEGGAMALATARVSILGAVEDEQIVDERVCDCCPTSAIALADGSLLVAYRDRSETEVRDIALARGRTDDPETWTAGEIVHADGWKIEGCPVNGPRLAARGQDVALAWYTAASDAPQVELALSRDGGRSFDAPVRVDEGWPMGQVDTILLDDSRVLVTWLEADGMQARWLARAVGLDGELGPAVSIAEATGARDDGALRLTREGDSILAAWTLAGEQRIALARIR